MSYVKTNYIAMIAAVADSVQTDDSDQKDAHLARALDIARHLVNESEMAPEALIVAAADGPLRYMLRMANMAGVDVSDFGERLETQMLLNPDKY